MTERWSEHHVDVPLPTEAHEVAQSAPALVPEATVPAPDEMQRRAEEEEQLRLEEEQRRADEAHEEQYRREEEQRRLLSAQKPISIAILGDPEDFG